MIFIDAKYVVSTLAGNGQPGDEEGELLRSKFFHPFGICVDNVNDICYFVDAINNKIRKFPLL